MANQISHDVSQLLKLNNGYKFNSWLMTSAINDIKHVYTSALGDDSTVAINSNNLYSALFSFHRFNSDLHVAEYSTFLDIIIRLQINS